jgi:glycosyltransferase involved in cell wall biosynthesis
LTTSVVICAYSLERWPDLVEAVDSLRAQLVGRPEIVVVVDHNDALLERSRAELPADIVVPNQHQRGLSGARNTGVAAASGEVVAFLDDDAIAAKDWLQRLGDAYTGPEVLGVGGLVVPRWAGGRKPRWFPREFGWVVGCSYLGQPTRIAPVRNLIGANMSYRMDVLLAAGGFREGIGRIGRRPLGCEETELSIRALQRFPGGQVLFDPGARVEHTVPRSRQGPRYFLERCYAEGLSKALVTRLVGTASGLSSERTYTLRVLPRGVLAGLIAGVRGDIAGFGRAVAIVVGLATTTLGYVVGRLHPEAAFEDPTPPAA